MQVRLFVASAVAMLGLWGPHVRADLKDVVTREVQVACRQASIAGSEAQIKELESSYATAMSATAVNAGAILQRWQHARAQVAQQRTRISQLEDQIATEQRALERTAKPAPQEVQAETAAQGVAEEISTLMGLHARVGRDAQALAGAESANCQYAQFDTRSCEQLRAVLGQARKAVADYQREHGDLLRLQEQLDRFLDERDRARAARGVPSPARLRDFEKQLAAENRALNESASTAARLRQDFQYALAVMRAAQEMRNWVQVCIDGRRQQLAAAAPLPAPTRASAGEVCRPSSGPLSCSGEFSAQFRTSCYSDRERRQIDRTSRLRFWLIGDGTVRVISVNEQGAEHAWKIVRLRDDGVLFDDRSSAADRLAGKLEVVALPDGRKGLTGSGTYTSPYCRSAAFVIGGS